MKTSKELDAFEHTTVPYGDDNRLVRGVIARCGHCGAAIPLPVNTMPTRSGKDDEIEWRFIARKLEAKGWRIGRSRSSHRCPKCFTAAKCAAVRNAQASHQAAARINSEGAPIMQVIENTRTMTREDRRIIFDKLNQVYVDGKIGYGDGWTDERVATDLGVPRAWVKLLRDENFGDEVSNQNIRAEIKQAENLLEQIHKLQPEILRLMSLADKMEKSLAEIRRVFK